MKTLNMEYIETPIAPSGRSKSSGIDEHLLSARLDTFLRTRKTEPFTKLLKRLME